MACLRPKVDGSRKAEMAGHRREVEAKIDKAQVKEEKEGVRKEKEFKCCTDPTLLETRTTRGAEVTHRITIVVD